MKLKLNWFRDGAININYIYTTADPIVCEIKDDAIQSTIKNDVILWYPFESSLVHMPHPKPFYGEN